MKLNSPSPLYYFSLTSVLLLSLICSFKLILFLFTTIISALFGIFFFLELNSTNVALDFEIFNKQQTDPIYFVRCDHRSRKYLSDAIENKVQLVQKLELTKKFMNNYEIDNQLNEVLELIIKNHIHPWFQIISPTNQEFPIKFYLLLNHILSALITRLKQINLADLITTKLVDEITKHKRLYRMTKSKLKCKIHTQEELIRIFFNIERKSEKTTHSHEKVCLDLVCQFQFLSRICDILQYTLFPYESFGNETFKIITKQIFIKMILLPLFEAFSEPDFVNRIIILLLKSNYPSTETFISVLQSTDDVNELRSVLESVENEILFVRSKDQDDSDVMKMKQQLNSLLYLKKIILSHLKKFDVEVTSTASDESHQHPTPPSMKSSIDDKISIPFDTILRHNVALEYFIEYMVSINAESYINFYINVQTFKISIEQGLFEIYLISVNDSVTNEQYQQLQNDVRDTALNIYETYLSFSSNQNPNGSSSGNQLTMVDPQLCQQLYETLMSDDSSQWMNDGLFDDIFFQVRDILLNHPDFFPSFCQSEYYCKLLGEPDLYRDSLDDETVEVNNQQSDIQKENVKSQRNPLEDNKNQQENQRNSFKIDIIDTGILNLQGKSFIGYLINIEKKNGENWTILRRYSEFFNFHQVMLEKCQKFHLNIKSILILPPKTVLSNRMNENFIQYRRCMLNVYLKKLSYIHEKFIFLREDIERFLQPGNYDFNSSKNLMLNPIKTIGNVFKSQSENLLDGFQRLSRTLSLQTDLHKTTTQQQYENKRIFQTNSLGSKCTVNDMKQNSDSSNDLPSMDWINHHVKNDIVSSPGSNSANEYEENIPLLLLLDEVFDMESQNFWFRRRIIELFKQIVEVAFSDTINKRMVDRINEWTSSSSISNYIESFKNVFWPDGNMARSSIPKKKKNCFRRKVAAKALILTFLSDLKKVVGNETLQTGLISFFELFQYKTLNLRLLFVLFELTLKELFPDSYFDEIFNRLYGAFDDKSLLDDINDWPPHLSKFVAKS